MTKLHFCPYTPNQTLLFPNRIDEGIAKDNPIWVVYALVDGRWLYHPQMMLKIIIYVTGIMFIRVAWSNYFNKTIGISFM